MYTNVFSAGDERSENVCVLYLASFPGLRVGRERRPGTHCLRMRVIYQISGKIGYFSNLLCIRDGYIIEFFH